MPVASRLRAAFALYVVLLAAVLAFLAHATRRPSVDLTRVTVGAVHVVPIDTSVVAQLQSAQLGTQLVTEASRAALQRELDRAEHTARLATRTALVVTVVVALLTVVLCAYLVRAILRPLA